MYETGLGGDKGNGDEQGVNIFAETGASETIELGVIGYGKSDWHEKSNVGTDRRVCPF